MRIPLVYPLESRDGTLAKDSKLKNCIFEMIEGQATAVKRPGISGGSEVVAGGGLAQGMVSLNGIVYSVVDDELYTLPVTPASGGGGGPVFPEPSSAWVQI